MSELTHMFASLPLVLAKGEAAGLIFFAIWIILALVSSAQKKKQQNRASQLPLPPGQVPPREQTLPRNRSASPRFQLRRTTPAQSSPWRISPPRVSQAPPHRPPAVRALPPKHAAPADISVENPVWQPMKDMVQSQWAQTTTRSSQMQLMLQPATVRQGIVLAEILRPPLSLREEESAW